jgi:hypothetical protein
MFAANAAFVGQLTKVRANDLVMDAGPATRAVADCDLRRPEFRSAKAARNRCARLTATPASSARWSGTIDNELVRKDFAKAAEWIKRGGVELT